MTLAKNQKTNKAVGKKGPRSSAVSGSQGLAGNTAGDGNSPQNHDGNRRDFLYLATGAMATVGTACAVWPFIDSMNPAADVLSTASIEVDLSKVGVGQSLTIMWRGKPVFIRHRTQEEILEAEDAPLASMPDPESDEKRVEKAPWIVVIGVCTHLGCVPLGQKSSDNRGEYGGWYCPCHGSHYDTSGRIRKGPAPKNLVVPEYQFINETTLKLG